MVVALAVLFCACLQQPPPSDLGEVDSYTQIWIDGKAGKHQRRKLPVLGKGLNIHALALSSDGTTLAGADGDGPIYTWNLATQRRTATISGGAKYPNRLEFFDKDRSLLASSWEGPVTLWGLKSGRAEQAYDGFTRFAPSVDRTSATLWSKTDARLRSFDPVTAQLLRQRTSTADQVRAMELSPDSRFLAVAGYPPNCIAMINLETGGILYRMETKPASLSGHALLKFSPDGSLLIWCVRDRIVHISDAASGHELAQFKIGGLMIQQIDFSPDGRIFAFAGVGDSDFCVMDWRTLGLVATFMPTHGSGTSTVLFSRDGKRLYGGANEWGVILLDLEGAEQVQPSVLRPDDTGPSLWAELATPEAGKGLRAMHAMAELARGGGEYLAVKLEALPPLGDPAQILPRLLAELDDDQPETRSRAFRDLVRLGGAAEAALRKLLEGKPSAEAQGAATRILAELRSPGVSPEQAHTRRHRALYALGRLHTPASLAALIELSKDGEDCIRRQAAAAVDRAGLK